MAENFNPRNVRPPAVAGAFYEADPDALSGQIDDLLAAADVQPQPHFMPIVLAPHAGHVYSGPVAARAYNAVAELPFSTVIVAGVAHRVAVPGAALYASGAFATPLGPLAVDEDMAQSLLAASPLFKHLPRAHEGEHSIEVQLPFIQRLRRKGLKILPVLLNNPSSDILRQIGLALGGELKKGGALLVLSSDLSHFPADALARRADASVLRALGIAVERKNPDYFMQAEDLLVSRGEDGLDTVCCGAAAVTAGIHAALALGAAGFQVLDYATSADQSGEAKRVVGYGAGIFSSRPVKNGGFSLLPAEKKELLALARNSIERHLGGEKPQHPPLSKNTMFNVPAAAFVTLHKNGGLRGCIGSLEARQLLQDAVCGLALSSAFEDPRFPPLEKAELKACDIEISVLSPLERVPDASAIRPGVHGVLVRRGRQGGTYLPQVWENFGAKEAFLDSLCEEKAGLPAEAWRDGSAELYIYTADVFGEKGR
ncbi:MAG: AmmeMemoRadiSam system protein B [Elusimicrobia bacterium]|nr:AmmeMemoRadiSam system protein B [Elusimicrobiota bacterium]